MNKDVAAYLLFMAGSAVLCALLYALSARRQMKLAGGRSATLGAVTLGLGIGRHWERFPWAWASCWERPAPSCCISFSGFPIC